MYKCTHYIIQELVDANTYDLYGEHAWQYFDINSLHMIDDLWEYCNKYIFSEKPIIIINNWNWGGRYNWSGLRTIFCEIGADRSMHRFAKGFDLKFKGLDQPEEYEEMRRIILKHQDHPLLVKIARIEADTKSWLHIDSANIPDSKRIQIVRG